jgi:hypothetical protein
VKPEDYALAHCHEDRNPRLFPRVSNDSSPAAEIDKSDWMVGNIHIVAHAETGDSGPEGNYSCLCRQVVIDPD